MLIIIRIKVMFQHYIVGTKLIAIINWLTHQFKIN